MDDLEAVRGIVEILAQFDEKEVQQRIIRWSLEKSGLQVAPLAAPEGRTVNESNDTQFQARHPNDGTDIKSFITQKSPSSDNQFAAAVAYYYSFEAPAAEKKGSISAADLTDACRMVGRARLGDPAKTLGNAMSMGYLDKIDRGTYKLNTVGENLVAMTLPGGSGDSAPRARKKIAPAKKARRPKKTGKR
jgi:hypothetical protein